MTGKTPLTVEEVSQRSGVPSATLRWWRAKGTGPRSFRIGRKIVYDADVIDAWIQRRKAQTSVGSDTFQDAG